jgi:hypothetical protein
MQTNKKDCKELNGSSGFQLFSLLLLIWIGKITLRSLNKLFGRLMPIGTTFHLKE